MAKKKKDEEKVKRVFGDKVATPVVRTSYSYVTTPDSGREFSDDKYKFAAMLPSERSAELKPLKQEMLKVAKEAFGKDITWKKLKTPFVDGNEKDNPEYKDHIIFNVKSKRKPGVIVGKSKTKFNDLSEEEQKELALDNAGYHVIAMVTPSSYKRSVEVEREDADGNIKTATRTQLGINLNLESIWYVKNDERFGGGGDASSDFAEIDVSADEFDDDELEGDDELDGDENDEFSEDDDDLI